MEIPEKHMALIIHDPGQYIFVLGIVPIQPRTQALARCILNRYPKITARTWTWKKGEGLSSGDKKIKFIKPPVTHSPHPQYPGEEPKLPIKLALEHGYKTFLNHEKNGVEIHFNGPIPSELSDVLKTYGFRYSGKLKLWYARQSPNTNLFARRMKG